MATELRGGGGDNNNGGARGGELVDSRGQETEASTQQLASEQEEMKKENCLTIACSWQCTGTGSMLMSTAMIVAPLMCSSCLLHAVSGMTEDCNEVHALADEGHNGNIFFVRRALEFLEMNVNNA